MLQNSVHSVSWEVRAGRAAVPAKTEGKHVLSEPARGASRDVIFVTS